MKNSASNSVIFPLGLSGVAQTTILHNAWTSMGGEGPAGTQTHRHAQIFPTGHIHSFIILQV